MKNLEKTKTEISRIINDSYHTPVPFESFVSQLINMGVTRFIFDAVKNEMQFYAKDQFIHSMIREDLAQAQKKSSWILGEKLDIPALEEAIKKLDAGNLSVVDFHRDMYSSGVVFCNVDLIPRKILYLGQDSGCYFENY